MQIIGSVDVVGFKANVENFDFHINQYKKSYSEIYKDYTSENRIPTFRHKERVNRFNKFRSSISEVNSSINDLVSQLKNQESKLSKVIDELDSAFKLFYKVEISNKIHDQGEENFNSLTKSAEELRDLCSSYADKLPEAKLK